METMRLQKKFVITNYTPPYEPAQMRKPNFKVIQDYDSYIEYAYSKSHKLFIKNEAMKQIFHHIGWGKKSELNVVEQGGILLGQVFRDENRKLTYGIAEKAIAGSLARGSSAYLDMTHETWKQMLDSMDEILNENPEKNLQVIGWYHTHPNELSVFMSDTDRSTQRRLFSHDWQFAIVLNPHKQIWKSFYGIDAEECRGFVIDGTDDLESNYFPATTPPAEDVEPLDHYSNQDAEHDPQIVSTEPKKAPWKLWSRVKMPFGRKRGNEAPPENQKRMLPKQNRRFRKVRVNEMKLNFFIWFSIFILLVILSLQIVTFYLRK